MAYCYIVDLMSVQPEVIKVAAEGSHALREKTEYDDEEDKYYIIDSGAHIQLVMQS